MTTKTATITHAGHTFTATVRDGRVAVAEDGVWAGEGRYTKYGIEDCPAILGDEDASESIYRLLDAALEEAAVRPIAYYAHAYAGHVRGAVIDGCGPGFWFRISAKRDDGSRAMTLRRGVHAEVACTYSRDGDVEGLDDLGRAFLDTLEIVISDHICAASEALDLADRAAGRRPRSHFPR